MKNFKKISILLLVFVIFLYVCNITLIPNNIILVQGEKLSIQTMLGISIKQVDNNENSLYLAERTIQTSSSISATNVQQMGKLDFNLNFLGTIPIKNITVNVIPKTKVIPLGNAIGMKLYTKGVLVVGMSEIESEDKTKHKPYENIDIKEGDRIIQVNNQTVACTTDLVHIVNQSEGAEVNITYIREEDTLHASIKPTKTGEKEYKLGLWVRDAAAGVGTLSFYEPSTGMFGALGHGITDIDTGDLIHIANGELVTTQIVAITKGEKGKTGEVRGTIEGSQKIGDIYQNTEFGIYGKVSNKNVLGIDKSEEVEVALREEIKEGKAEIITQLDGKQKERYEIEIQKVYKNNNQNNKSMMIKVTDERLLEKTGGIIQRNEWKPNYSKWKICWCSYTCIS